MPSESLLLNVNITYVCVCFNTLSLKLSQSLVTCCHSNVFKIIYSFDSLYDVMCVGLNFHRHQHTQVPLSYFSSTTVAFVAR